MKIRYVFLIFFFLCGINVSKISNSANDTHKIELYHQIKFPRTLSNKEKNCLDLNIYHESRGEKNIGQIAVAVVTLNRTLSNKFPNSVCKVVKQGYNTQSRSCAFSWYCNAKPDYPTNKVAWNHSKKISEFVLNNYGNLKKKLPATYYHALYIKPPYWTKGLHVSTKIGNHIFYHS